VIEIVNKGLNHLNGVNSGVTRHNIFTCVCMYVWNASVELYMCFCNCVIYSASYSHLTNFGSMECNVMYVCILLTIFTESMYVLAFIFKNLGIIIIY
jgi:hypothetical protein